MPRVISPTKRCNGPLCRGAMRPRSDFNRRRTASPNALHVYCRQCQGAKQTKKEGVPHGWVLRSQVLWIFEELVGRLGYAEAARRTGLGRTDLQRAVRGYYVGSKHHGRPVLRFKKETVRKAIEALRQAREAGESRSDAWTVDPLTGRETIRFDPKTVDASMKWARRHGVKFPSLEARLYAHRDYTELLKVSIADLDEVLARYGGTRVEVKDIRDLRDPAEVWYEEVEKRHGPEAARAWREGTPADHPMVRAEARTAGNHGGAGQLPDGPDSGSAGAGVDHADGGAGV